jgi:hypothetical protein
MKTAVELWDIFAGRIILKFSYSSEVFRGSVLVKYLVRVF